MSTIEHSTLLKLARDFVQQKRLEMRSLEGAFLVGSVARQEALLGGVVDLDIWLIDFSESEIAFPYVWLSNDVHIEFRRFSPSAFENKRALRGDPYLGPALFSAVPLYDPRHMLDLIQASLRSTYDSPENVYLRARNGYQQAQTAFKELGRYLRSAVPIPVPVKVLQNLHALVFHASIALMTLNRNYASGRRHFVLFNSAAHALQQAELSQMAYQVLGFEGLGADDFHTLLGEWEQLQTAYQASANLEWEQELAWDSRRNYFCKGWQTLVEGGQVLPALAQMEQNFLQVWQSVESAVSISELEQLQKTYQNWLALTGKHQPQQLSQAIWRAKDLLAGLDRCLLDWAYQNNLEQL
jgi:hypothetical protein